MLSNPELFQKVEEFICSQDSFRKWEEENGAIKGRMMIDAAELPEGVELIQNRDDEIVAFEASFDFYDVVLGIGIYPRTNEPATRVWFVRQTPDAELPDEVWVEFFLEKLYGAIRGDGSFGYPICSLVNDTSDVTIVPGPPRGE